MRAKTRTGAAQPDARTVGQIGLGIMGSAYAKHLREAGFELVGYDLDGARRAELRRLGGKAAKSPAEVARRCPIVITSLPSVAAVDAALFAKHGLLDGAAPGTVVIETSTLPLEIKLGVRDVCAERGVTVLDCPISGTGAQAAAKDIVVCASGPRTSIKACAPVFEGFARSVHYCGEFGNGSRLKYIANLLVTIHNLAAAEAIVLAQRSGLDLGLVYDVIRDGAGTSRMFEIRAPMMVAGDYRKATMKVDVYQKDIDIISSYASGLHCPTPLFEASKAFYSGAYAQGYAKEDTASICAVLEKMAGISRSAVRKPRTKRKASNA